MNSYYDIDAILTDAQKVPCIFDLDIPGLGYLDENAGGDVPTHSSSLNLLPLNLFPSPLIHFQKKHVITRPL